MAAGDFPDTKLVMVGGCRSDVDKQFVEELKALAKKLSIQVRSDVLHGKLAAYHLAHVSQQRQDKVEFRINAPIEDLKELLATCSVGIHTMWNEHFGIGVVEMMAAGVPPIAHDSGGPALDIVGGRRAHGHALHAAEAGGLGAGGAHAPEVGLLATSAQQYADAMAALLLEPHAEPRRRAMATAARASVQERFSEAAFSDAFCASLAPALAV